MTQFASEWVAHQRRRFLRHDAHRFLRHDYERFLKVGPLTWPISALVEAKANFNPSQPRAPKGNPDGGRWTGDPSSSDSETTGSGRRDTTFESSSSKRVTLFRRGSRPHGHHDVPIKIYSRMKLLPETRKVFDEAKTGRLYGQTHRGGDGHPEYTEAVEELLGQYMKKNNIKEETMTPAQAREFVSLVKRSGDPRIRDFNLRIWRRELQYWIRRGPRRE